MILNKSRSLKGKHSAMSTSSLVLLSLLSHLTILCAQLPGPDWACTYCFHDTGNFTNTSTYQSNLNIVLSNLTSNTEIDYGFYNLSHGQHPDRVSTIGLCRGDITPDECHACLKNASLILPMSCPNMREAMAGSDECFLRQSNRSIFRVMESDASCIWWNRYDTTEQDKYNEVSGLLEGLRSKAKNGDSLLKYAEAYQTAPNLQNIFGAVQCTPDLSQQDCSNCLKTAISELPNCCFAKRGGRVIKPSCNARYENYRFFGPMAEDSPPLPPSPLSPPTTSTSKGHSRQSIITIIAIVLPTAAIILVLICVFSICWRMRKGREAVQTEAELDGQIEFLESLQLDFETIRTATDKFSDANKLGQGGFGPVYKGKLHNGEVAVKRLSKNSGQGDIEFKNEVKLVAKLQHRNLARLLGFCLERGERLLIYEFLPNKSLDYLLFDPNHHAQLNWETHHKIIIGVARGLHYFHGDSQLRIIHRDLKKSNIFLDAELNPKVFDFGMAGLFVVDQSQSNTSRIVGTYGYMVPEYAMRGQFSMKSDVFSFSVLILEIISGKKNNSIFHGENVLNLLSFAWKNWREGTTSNIVGPVLNNDSNNEIKRCIHIELLCVQENVADRPTMASAALMLDSHSITLSVPSEPPFLMCNRSLPEMNSGENSSSGGQKISWRRKRLC